MANALDNLDVQYTYHVHEGSASTTANGCYTKENYETCNVTSSSKYLGKSQSENGYYGFSGTRCTNGNHYYVTEITYNHSFCGNTHIIYSAECSCASDGWTPHYQSRVVTAGGGTSSHSIFTGYDVGCGKTEDTIESATIIY